MSVEFTDSHIAAAAAELVAHVDHKDGVRGRAFSEHDLDELKLHAGTYICRIAFDLEGFTLSECPAIVEEFAGPVVEAAKSMVETRVQVAGVRS